MSRHLSGGAKLKKRKIRQLEAGDLSKSLLAYLNKTPNESDRNESLTELCEKTDEFNNTKQVIEETIGPTPSTSHSGSNEMACYEEENKNRDEHETLKSTSTQVNEKVIISCSSDIALWPEVITDKVREQFLIVKPGCGNVMLSGITYTDRGRKYTRHLTEQHFFRQKTNGTRERREWLIFSETSSSAYCYVCKLFSNAKNQMTEGCKDWKNITTKLAEHENSNEHISSMWKLSKRLSQSGRIDSEITKQIESERNYWRKMLKRIVATVKFLASQGLAFRGNEEKMGLRKGNFLSCLNYLSEFDPFMADHLKKYSNQGQGSVSYLSHTICDEFITVMANDLKQQFVKEVKSSIYFSIIVDSTPDISHVDQLTFVLRYLTLDGEIKERFFGFIPINAHDSQYLEKTVVETLASLEIDIKLCRGQSYDNAANMAGKYTGLQTRIKSHSPEAEFIPCTAHSLNLVCNYAAESCSAAIRYFSFVQNLYTFFSASTHRWDILKSCLTVTEGNVGTDNLTVKKLSDTRWSARVDAVSAVKKCYSKIKKALLMIVEDQEQKNLVKLEAKSLANEMDLFETAFLTILWNSALQRINATSKSLQKTDLSLFLAIKLLKSLKQYIQDLRNDFQSLVDQTKHLVAEEVYADDTQRAKKRKLFYDETSETEITLRGKENFIVNVFYVICDNLISELLKRVCSYDSVNSSFEIFFLDVELSEKRKEKCIENLKKNYRSDIDCEAFDGELQQFLLFSKQEKITSPSEMYQLLLRGLKSTFPNVETILRIYLTLPISNASGERSFSVLKRVKNYLRNNMSQERLSSLALLCIEHEETNKRNYDDIIDIFAKQKSRKKLL